MESKKGVRKEMDMKKLSDAVDGKPMEMPSMVNLTEKDLPEVKKWRVGKTYQVMLTLKQVSSSSEYSDQIEARFEIVKAEVEDPGEEKGEKYKEES